MSGKEPKRSRVCSICGANSETYHLNYGVSSCFSCRAFFRRALERTRNPKFNCKFGGKCEITEKNRKCRKCRFDKCIGQGMKRDLVMDDTQKVQRFRKLIRQNLLADPEKGMVVKYKKASKKTSSMDMEPMSNGDQTSEGTNPKIESWNGKWDRIIAENSSLGHFKDSVIRFHSSSVIPGLGGTRELDREYLVEHLKKVASLFRNFAQDNTEFSELPTEDQETLLKANTTKFLSLIIANYLTLPFPDGINWLLLGQIIPGLEDLALNKSSPAFLCFSIGLAIGEDFPGLISLLEEVDMFQFNCSNIGSIALGILFHIGDQSNVPLEEPTHVSTSQNEIFHVLESLVDVEPFMNCLQQISKKVIPFWFPEVTQDSHSLLPVSSLAFEDSYERLQTDLQYFAEVNDIVNYGEDLMMECIMFNFDVPLTKRFYGMIAQIWAQRFFYVLRKTTNIKEKPVEVQNQILARMVLPLIALVQARMEALPVVEEQIRFCCGTSDIEEYIDKYRDIVPDKSYQLMKIRSMNKNYALYDKETQDDLVALNKELMPMVADETLFRIIILFTMAACVLDPANDNSDIYVKHFKYQLESKGHHDPDLSLAICVQNTKKLTKVMSKP
eukprot:snap_masked-scaffold235_size242898-processed-gene-1.1 protein:Tk06562 transcript:snap_masked-scaffold235_size242898-processed-gene-1.1-mRNA-1 annotation:"thyroid hormone receptor alpha a"